MRGKEKRKPEGKKGFGEKKKKRKGGKKKRKGKKIKKERRKKKKRKARKKKRVSFFILSPPRGGAATRSSRSTQWLREQAHMCGGVGVPESHICACWRSWGGGGAPIFQKTVF